ncbi:transglycosylase domain-containing protein [Pannonibacter sp. Pt2-lr]
MPDILIKATLATEDRRFFEHFGIDVLGTSRAMVENLRARTVVQGGSSLTQQLAKTSSSQTSGPWSARSRRPSSPSGLKPTSPSAKS